MNDRSATIGSGFDLLGVHYDVHQWFGDVRPQLAYGRDVQSNTTGIALGVLDGIYTLITYKTPTVSALAVSQLKEFLSADLKPTLSDN
mmetsp:Transcript_750/g.1441  ORF Transcript_750/g.1441 Transcript_750/m.1441 type:complete len:88 (-) Transcript_750:216-479(-)